MKTTVIFRTWKKYPHDVIALFPYVNAHIIPGKYCSSYMHVGQHSGADYVSVMKQTRPSTPEEYAPLAEELKSMGYDLRIAKRKTSWKRQRVEN